MADQVLLDNAEATISDDVRWFIGRNGPAIAPLRHTPGPRKNSTAARSSVIPACASAISRSTIPFWPGENPLGIPDAATAAEPDWKCGEVAGQFELRGAYSKAPSPKCPAVGRHASSCGASFCTSESPATRRADQLSPICASQILLEHFLQSHRSACLMSRTIGHSSAQPAITRSTCRAAVDELFPARVRCLPGFRTISAVTKNARTETNMAKRRHLEDFIARNKAGLDRHLGEIGKPSSSERLELAEIASDEPTARSARRASSRAKARHSAAETS